MGEGVGSGRRHFVLIANDKKCRLRITLAIFACAGAKIAGEK